MTAVKGFYESSPTLVTASKYKTLGINARGALVTCANVASPSLYTNYGAAATANVKATPGRVVGLRLHNSAIAAAYFQLFNTATTPSAAAVPLETFLVGASSQLLVDNAYFQAEGMTFSVGIAFGYSSTEHTYTAGVAASQSITVIYY